MDGNYKKPWYKNWWGILIILMLGMVLSFVFASAFYIYNLAKKIQSGEIDPDKLFGKFQTEQTDRVSNIDIKGRPFIGAENAEIVIVGFMDFECPFCRESYNVIKKAVLSPSPRHKEKIKFVFRHFPLLGDHENALISAQAAECAYSQGKFWEMADYIYYNQDKLSETILKSQAAQLGLNYSEFSRCFDSEALLDIIKKDLNYGISLGVEATPIFFFDGHKFEGAVNQEVFNQIVNMLISK